MYGAKDYKNTRYRCHHRDGTVQISQNSGFSPISKEVWSHTIGSYQPAQKWLKDRKGMNLTAKDIRHYNLIVESIIKTNKLMSEIDSILDEIVGGD